MNDSIKMSKQRRWSESKANSSWQIFKIMAEFVDGFEALSKIGPCISIFGSARTTPSELIMNFPLKLRNGWQKKDSVLFQEAGRALWRQQIKVLN